MDSHPVLIQELRWCPPALVSTTEIELTKDVTLSFYNGELFQITVNYDRYSTEGMTSDLVDSMSATYGVAAKPKAAVKSAFPQSYGDPEEVLAQWEDAQYRLALIRRTTFAPTFLLIGVFKKLEGPAQIAIAAATRFEALDAPSARRPPSGREARRTNEARKSEALEQAKI